MSYNHAENPLSVEDRQYNALDREELETCRLKLLEDEKEIIEYAAKREAKIERKLERNKVSYEEWTKEQTKEISRLEAELHAAREEKEAAKAAYENGNETVKHQRFSEQEGYRSQLLELRKRRKEVESLLKSKEGEQIWNSSCSPAEFPSTSSGSSVQIQESESDGQQQIEHGHRQPPGAYWDDL